MLLGTQRINALGNLEIGGCDATRLAAEFGTPLYVMDEALIRDNCRRYRAAFEERYPQNVICFAGKAFMTMAMCRILEEEGLSLDVASLGELYLALQSGFPVERISLHGNNKSREELEMALRSGIGHIVVDNFLEIQMLSVLVRESGAQMDVLVRCSPGVDPNTHKFISTGQADTKFGFNIKDGSALQAVKEILEIPQLRFDGIHCHVGSQLLDTESHEGAVRAMIGLMKDIRDETGEVCRIVNIGGGLGVRYRSHHQPPSYEEFADIVTSRLTSALESAGLPLPILQQEPGRALVGEAGTTLYTVGSIKTVPITEEPGFRTYVSVDGGLSDNPRPQLYDAEYEIIAASKATLPHDHTIALAGKHCETDVLIWDAKAPELESGDIVAVQTTGAYNFVMASNYNRFLKPAVVLVKDGDADLIVERETLPDLLRHEVIPPRLRKKHAESAVTKSIA